MDDPQHFNCRCIMIMGMPVPWIVELQWIMDEVFGDTDPLLDNYIPEPVGILNG